MEYQALIVLLHTAVQSKHFSSVNPISAVFNVSISLLQRISTIPASISTQHFRPESKKGNIKLRVAQNPLV